MHSNLHGIRMSLDEWAREASSFQQFLKGIAVWYDYSSLPQITDGQTLPKELKIYQQHSLHNLNDLIQASSVVILNGADFLGRAWCRAEAYTAASAIAYYIINPGAGVRVFNDKVVDVNNKQVNGYHVKNNQVFARKEVVALVNHCGFLVNSKDQPHYLSAIPTPSTLSMVVQSGQSDEFREMLLSQRLRCTSAKDMNIIYNIYRQSEARQEPNIYKIWMHIVMQLIALLVYFPFLQPFDFFGEIIFCMTIAGELSAMLFDRACWRKIPFVKYFVYCKLPPDYFTISRYIGILFGRFHHGQLSVWLRNFGLGIVIVICAVKLSTFDAFTLLMGCGGISILVGSGYQLMTLYRPLKQQLDALERKSSMSVVDHDDLRNFLFRVGLQHLFASVKARLTLLNWDLVDLFEIADTKQEKLKFLELTDQETNQLCEKLCDDLGMYKTHIPLQSVDSQ
eukprot:Lithocolla_globosa_v1_NODE_1956_length_2240_cov_10.544165.p1 type:complete len:452 gc:universal NODE_1956_length_2240_cov_10.544165:1459-104(-)